MFFPVNFAKFLSTVILSNAFENVAFLLWSRNTTAYKPKEPHHVEPYQLQKILSVSRVTSLNAKTDLASQKCGQDPHKYLGWGALEG